MAELRPVSIDAGARGISRRFGFRGYMDGPASLASIPPPAALREARRTRSPERSRGCSATALAAADDGSGTRRRRACGTRLRPGSQPTPLVARSSFRDWAAEETDHPREVSEAALGHMVRNRVEAAYRRTDLSERAAAAHERLGGLFWWGGERASIPDACATGSQAVSAWSGGYSGNLRATGSPRIDDRRSPRDTG